MDPRDFLPALNKTAERYRKRVQDLVEYCPTCQPYEGGEYVWIHGKETTLEDLFDNVNCPERYRDDIAEHIQCPNCGSNTFDRYDTIGTEDPYVIEAEELIKDAIRKHGKHVQELNEHLTAYPSLALGTRLGRRLHREITQHVIPSYTISGTWYRARLVSDSRVFQADDMGPAPIGRAHNGRYHHEGQSILYLAKYDSTAVREAVNNPDSECALIWLQKYEIKLDNLLDLRSNLQEFVDTNLSPALVAALAYRLFDQPVEDRKSTWKPQYFVTQFIADCARLAGYSGILYSSTRGLGDNVAIFNSDSPGIKAVERPHIYIHEPPRPFVPKKIVRPEDLF